MKRNIKLIVEYDGTEFVGWQRQLNGRSVQEEIEKTLSTLTRERVTIVGAGRTDSGVHARGQTANFFYEGALSVVDFQRALNGLLPEDIVVHSAEDVEETFSSRFSAKSREYKYNISLRPAAIVRRYCWQLSYEFDVERMNRAATTILGLHDFQAFCKSETDVEHYRCEVLESQWTAAEGSLVYSVKANRFLHGMVRTLVGTMVNVGRGFTPEEDFIKILTSKDRSQAGQSAPAKGLFLERVTY